MGEVKPKKAKPSLNASGRIRNYFLVTLQSQVALRLGKRGHASASNSNRPFSEVEITLDHGKM
jgi:hypothetical protein